MEILPVLTFLIVFVLLIIVINNNSTVNNKIEKLIREINLLKMSLQKMERGNVPPKIESEPKPKEKTPEKIESIEMTAKPLPGPTIVEEKIFVSQEPKKPEPIFVNAQAARSSYTAKRAPEPKKPKEHADFERFIGENLISKIGIIILVLGVGFFVKFAIDQNWINEYGRTAIGLIIGGALIGIAHYMRKSYKTFSSLLTGGGIAVFYLTIAIAFHQYHIFSQTAAFILLVLITIFSVILSLVYDKKELAIFSQIGGYAAPFMISTGEGNYQVLFSYMLILNAGLIALAYFKRWHVLNLLAFIFTVVIYSSWLGSTFWNNDNPPYLGAFIFASLFYLVFFFVNALNNLKEQKPFSGIEMGMLLSNNLFYFLSGLAILNNFHGGIYKGLFTVMIGLYNFGWVLYLYRKQQVDKNFIFLLIGLVMSFISIAIPIQLNGHSITLFWTAEFVILFWLSQKSGIKLLKIGHLIVLILAFISLIMDWAKLYGDKPTTLPIIFNQAFVTGIVALTGLVLAIHFLRKETEESFIKYFISVKTYKVMITFLLFAMAYFVPFLELQYQMNNYYNVLSFRHAVYGIYNYAYLLSILFFIWKFNWNTAFKWFLGIGLGSLFIHLVYYHVMVLQTRDAYYFEHSVSVGNFLFHYLMYPFILGIILLIFKEKDKIFAKNSFWSKAFLWYLAFYIVFAASAELDNLLLLAFKTTDESIYSILKMSHKVGYPILWGIGAFILILWGMRTKIKDYRIIALSLIGLILLKLFLIDFWSMSKGGRIAAFFFLGIVLLSISFLYQKLKLFITEDSPAKPTPENL